MSGEEEYSDEVSTEEINAIVNRSDKVEAENVKLNQALSVLNTDKKEGNFLHHQISTDDMLDKLEHFYSGDKQGYNADGDLVWKKQNNKELKTFNEFGVTSLMEIIVKYIDKNTMLSSYTEDRIYQIIADLGSELILFVLCNYEKMGMDTHFKKTKFRLIITTTTHIIESTYRRAIGGKTLLEINQSRVVGQFGDQVPIQQGRPKREGWLSRTFR